MRKVSIIIPACNSLPQLKKSVDSVLTHTRPPYELIVCDRGSTDGSLSWCRTQPLVLLSLPRQTRLADACNKGLRVASGDALLILGADTLVTARWLHALTDGLHSAADAGIAGPVSNRAGGCQQFIPAAAQPVHDGGVEWLEAEHVDSFCFLMKREVWDRCGELPAGDSPDRLEMVEYCRKAAAAGYRTIVVKEALVLRQER